MPIKHRKRAMGQKSVLQESIKQGLQRSLEIVSGWGLQGSFLILETHKKDLSTVGQLHSNWLAQSLFLRI